MRGRLLAMAVLTAPGCLGAALAAPLFPGPVLPLDRPPLAIATGDFNGDGIPDLAVATSLDEQGQVLVGLGPVTVATPMRSYPVGFRPLAVATGDVDGDGIADLAVLSLREKKVSILVGRGDGGFEARPAVVLGEGPGTLLGGFPQALALGDLDGDGLDDLAVVDLAQPLTALATGDGHFAPPIAVPWPAGGRPVAVHMADLDGDGRSDLVVADANLSQVTILPARPGGVPGEPEPLDVGRVPQAIALADLNDDGHLDLAVADLRSDDPATQAGEVRILPGDGSGGFEDPVSHGVGLNPLDIAVTDLDGDGLLDLLVASIGSSDITILQGVGGGAFAPRQVLYAGISPVSLAVADLDQDGVPDAAVAAAGTVGLPLLAGDGRGALLASPRLAMPDGAHPGSIQGADFNGDGHVDLAVPTSDVLGPGPRGRLVFFPGTGGGEFAGPEDVAIGIEPGRSLAGDLDGDGLVDLALPVSFPPGVSIVRGSLDGGLLPAEHLDLGPGPFDLASGDLDEDGRPDLAVLAVFPPRLAVFLAGESGFQSPTIILLDHAPTSILMADATRDGQMDILVSISREAGTGELQVLPGDGRGGLGEALVIPRQDEPWLVRAAHLDRDPLLDLVAVTALFRNVEILRNVHPGRRLQAATLRQRVPVFLTDLELADLDRDGLLDVVVAAPELGTVSVFRGRPGRRFGPEERYLAGSGPASLAVADLDGDGWLDLAVANGRDRDVVLCLNGGGSP